MRQFERSANDCFSDDAFLTPMTKPCSRRALLGGGAAALAGCGLGASLLAAAEKAGQRKLERIGIIGGVPKEMAGDWKKSLRRVAEVGYSELEGGPKGDSVDDYLKFLKEINLTLVSCGVAFGKELKPDWLDKAKACKARYATTFWPWYYSPAKLTLSQMDEIADKLNKAGEEAKNAGLKFAVHNHDKEFRMLEGKTIFAHLLEKTDPKLVTIEMDIYWVVKGGADPVELFKRYPGRFELLHVKDMTSVPDGTFAAVGEGKIDFAKIFAHGETAGAKHYIVELEGDTATMQGIEVSCRNLQKLRF